MNRRDFLALSFRLSLTAFILAMLGRLGLAARFHQPGRDQNDDCHSTSGCRSCSHLTRCRHPNAFSFKKWRLG